MIPFSLARTILALKCSTSAPAYAQVPAGMEQGQPARDGHSVQTENTLMSGKRGNPSQGPQHTCAQEEGTQLLF